MFFARRASDTRRLVREAKRRLARTPLWLRLVAATLLLVTLAVTLTGLFAVQLLRGYLLDRTDQQLRAASAPLRPENEEPHADPRTPDTKTQRLYGLFYVVILNEDGTVRRTLAQSTDGAVPDLPALTVAEVARRGGRPFTVDSVGHAGHAWRVVAVPARTTGSRVVGISLSDIDTTVSRLAVIVACVGGAVLVLLGFACHWLVRRSLRPLGEIERTAQAIAGGDLSRRVPLRHRRTEMGRLGRAINGMLVQIEKAIRDRSESEAAARRSAEQARESAEAARRSAEAARSSEERMRRFVADASHELRTPLTSIRGFAELYRQEGSRDPDEAARVLRRIEGEAERMGLLVDDLLLLARLDQQRPLQRGQVDLLSLAAGVVLDAQTLAPDRPIELVRLDGADAPVSVTGDEARLRQVIGNLVGNALRHTPAGTPVLVGVGVDGADTVVEVADEGPGLPEGSAERVFERFYRADPARTRTDGGGAGLGLSIAAALVHAHGGTITVDSAPGQGATFRVRLPSRPPAG
ncbi:two-component system OmpR family sensor kinase [Thermocatellispora tengchongensis]|uniref:histidine kinase n=1 Tax=Thermocatellispora tengchongensis TaxID=1073253 RepID=A0A840PUF5_9ACTN|nr:HAMP domain-containing sensor histidine kinase [Thermocatellispora tengchongensis]MBB5139535.1 two-component system OmpR family sensor kinase [Thermocatellispora tengchongensis]